MSFDRQYVVSILHGGTEVFREEKVRCVFEVEKSLSQEPNQAHVRMLNLNESVENALIQDGDTLTLQVGYRDEGMTSVFKGEIYYTQKAKQDGKTFTFDVFALDGDSTYNETFVATTFRAGASQQDRIRALMGESQGSISAKIQNRQLPRGRVYFGLARDFLRQISKANDAAFYIDDDQISLISAYDTEASPFTLSPDTGLIGIPLLDGDGIEGYMQMYQALRLNSIVSVKVPSASSRMPIDGVYRITKLVYEGDTLGDVWRTHFWGVAQPGELPSMANNASEVF